MVNQETIYEIKSVSVDYFEDSYEHGQQLESFHSYFLDKYDFPFKTNHSSKKELIETINDFISYAEITEDDIEIYEDYIDVSCVVKYKKNSDWDEFSAPSEEEKEFWRKGEIKLYDAMFSFHCEAYKKEKLPI